MQGISKLFRMRIEEWLILLVEKVTEDFLITGTEDEIQKFLEALQARLDVGSVNMGRRFRLNVLEVVSNFRYNCVITLSMNYYVGKLHPLEISRVRTIQVAQRVTQVERTDYQALEGTLMYLGK